MRDKNMNALTFSDLRFEETKPDTFVRGQILQAADWLHSGEGDHMYRVITSSTSTRVAGWRTADLWSRIHGSLQGLQKDIGVLKSVVRWQHRKLEYQALYTAFLLGSLPEEEFVRESDEYVTEPTNAQMSPEELKATAQYVHLLTDGVLDPVDTAGFLGVEVEQVLDAIQLDAGGASQSE